MDRTYRRMDFDWRWHSGRRLSPGEWFLLRTNAEELDLRRAFCCAAGLCRTWVPLIDESVGSLPYTRVGKVGRAIYAGRVCGKFWIELKRSCGEWILSLD